MKGALADVFLHDGAPNVGSSWTGDAYAQNELVLHALKLACEMLRRGGTFVTKVFRSVDYNSLLWVFQQLFGRVEATKPQASRNVSAEIFVICLHYKAPEKLDPKFFDPKHVFMEVDTKAEEDPEKIKAKAGIAGLKDLIKQRDKKNRGGYEGKEMFKMIPATEFIESDVPAELLVQCTGIHFEDAEMDSKDSLDTDTNKYIREHKFTTGEIKLLCKDLQILGRGDLTQLMKWRFKIRKEKEKQETYNYQKNNESCKFSV